MSEHVSKFAIRLELPDMRGGNWTKLLRKVEPILGHPKDVDDDMDSPEDDCVFFFEYDDYDFVRDEDGWAVDRLLCPIVSSCESKGIDLSLENLQKKAMELSKKFGRKAEDCRLVCYSWHNGGDEPVVLRWL